MIRDDAAEALGQAEFFDICDEEQRRLLAFAGDMRLSIPMRSSTRPATCRRGPSCCSRARSRPSTGDGRRQALCHFRAGQRGVGHGADPGQAAPGDHYRGDRCAHAVRAADGLPQAGAAIADLAHAPWRGSSASLGHYLDALEPVRRKMKAE